MGDFYVLASGVDVDYQERRMKEGVDLFKKKKAAVLRSYPGGLLGLIHRDSTTRHCRSKNQPWWIGKQIESGVSQTYAGSAQHRELPHLGGRFSVGGWDRSWS